MAIDDEILAADDRRHAAMRANDADALASLLAADLVYTHASGKVDTRESYVAGIRAGLTRFQSVRREDAKVTMASQDVACLTGIQESHLTSEGAPRVVRLRFLNVWAREGTAWKMVAWMAQSQ